MTRDCFCPICCEPEAYGRNVRNATYHAQWKAAKAGPERWAVERRILARRRDAIAEAEIPAVVERAERWVVPRVGAPIEGVTREAEPYRVTATFAHLGTPELAAAAVALLRLQTLRPYIVIVDTGSTAADVRKIEHLRGHDCEIHYLKAHGYTHTSEPVAIACDLAFDRCRSDYIVYTHADCFLTARNAIEELAAICRAANPVVGYQLSDRSPHTEQWRWMVGHTLTIEHVRTIRRLGVRWGFAWGEAAGVMPNWERFIDTETYHNWGLRLKGVTPDLLDGEKNHARNITAHFDHPRSSGTRAIYPGAGTGEWRARHDEWLADALRDAKARANEWAGAAAPAAIKEHSLSADRIEQLRRCRHRLPPLGCGCSQRCSLKGNQQVSIPVVCDSCPDYQSVA